MDNIDFTLAFDRINWAVAFVLMVLFSFFGQRKDNKVLLMALASLAVAALFAGFGWFV